MNENKKENMSPKEWKSILLTTIIIIVMFTVVVIINGYSCYSADVTYPYSTVGLEIYNWVDQFNVNLGYILSFCAIPLILNIILMIISVNKLEKLNKKETKKVVKKENKKEITK